MSCIGEEVAQAEGGKQAAARHLAQLAAEHIRWTGRTLLPSQGCRLGWVPLGTASVLVEYEFQPAERRTHSHPGSEASATVLTVLINGQQFNPEGLIESHVIDGWETELARVNSQQREAA